uniref:Carbohydrate esterase family 4 protein n=1 Tax=Mycena chlorophos TaxID=658473 RepID=A0ABQ0LG90_MYCCL|nr:carbohydrate esterase family 4 protein [Mycena chlorophos]
MNAETPKPRREYAFRSTSIGGFSSGFEADPRAVFSADRVWFRLYQDTAARSASMQRMARTLISKTLFALKHVLQSPSHACSRITASFALLITSSNLFHSSTIYKRPLRRLGSVQSNPPSLVGRFAMLHIGRGALALPLALSIVLVAAGAAASTPKSPRAELISSCTVPGMVALTFDDGPYLYETNISQLLLSKGAKGTFFVNGNNYECIYGTKVAARLLETYQAGHQICSHTWSHPDLTDLDEADMDVEFSRNDEALYNILGIVTPYLRPPYGSYDTLTREVAFNHNKTLVLWDMDSEDSIGATVNQSVEYYKEFIANQSVTIALQHETMKTTAFELLPQAIDLLQAAGYKLVTLAECLDRPAYTVEDGPGQRNASTWNCHDLPSSSSSSSSTMPTGSLNSYYSSATRRK